MCSIAPVSLSGARAYFPRSEIFRNRPRDDSQDRPLFISPQPKRRDVRPGSNSINLRGLRSRRGKKADVALGRTRYASVDRVGARKIFDRYRPGGSRVRRALSRSISRDRLSSSKRSPWRWDYSLASVRPRSRQNRQIAPSRRLTWWRYFQIPPSRTLNSTRRGSYPRCPVRVEHGRRFGADQGAKADLASVPWRNPTRSHRQCRLCA